MKTKVIQLTIGQRTRDWIFVEDGQTSAIIAKDAATTAPTEQQGARIIGARKDGSVMRQFRHGAKGVGK
jgi:hypothetical protein